jgi:iron complex outermembrane recepter protein
MSAKSFKRHTLTTVAAVALILPGAAFAQTTDPAGQEATQIDEIVVTGIRGSLRASIEQKRDNENITEVITATDIGKLPDENVADSLQRVTGIQISRESGEGRNASIRGLAATTYINGCPATPATST